jgi:hypothetical protein
VPENRRSLRRAALAVGGMALLGACTMQNPTYDPSTIGGNGGAPGPDGSAGDITQLGDAGGASSLVAWWTFDDGPGAGTAMDSSGFGHHGKLDDGFALQTAWVEGKHGGAISFPAGGKSGVQIPLSTTLKSMRQLTVACWMKRVSASSATEFQNVIASQQDDFDATAESFTLEAYREDLEGFISTSSTAQKSGSGMLGVRVTAAGTRLDWVHVAMTYDGATLRLFRNGVDVGSEAITRPFVPSSKPFYIGLNKNGSTDQAFEGQLDDVVIYSRALPGPAIRDLANGGSPASH